MSVINADKTAFGGSEYITSSRGQAPPLVTTPFKVVDSGVCSPRFVRSTLYCIPTTSGLAAECRVPLGLVVQPLADLREGEVGWKWGSVVIYTYTCALHVNMLE